MALKDMMQRNQGVMYSFLFGVAMTIQINLTKLLLSEYQESSITFSRCFSFVFVTPVVEWEATKLLKFSDFTFYLLCSLIGVLPYCFGAASLVFMGVGDTTAIEFGTGLIFTGLIAHFVLDESLNLFSIILLVIDCLGVALVLQPSFLFGQHNVTFDSREIGAVLALSGALFNAIWCVMIRKLVHRNALLCFFGIFLHGMVGMAISGVWTSFKSAWSVPRTWWHAFGILGYGFLNILQVVAEFKAFESVQAKDVALMGTLSVVFSYAFQLTFFGEETELISIAGTVIVIICVICSAFNVEDYFFEIIHFLGRK